MVFIRIRWAASCIFDSGSVTHQKNVLSAQWLGVYASAESGRSFRVVRPRSTSSRPALHHCNTYACVHAEEGRLRDHTECSRPQVQKGARPSALSPHSRAYREFSLFSGSVQTFSVQHEDRRDPRRRCGHRPGVRRPPWRRCLHPDGRLVRLRRL